MAVDLRRNGNILRRGEAQYVVLRACIGEPRDAAHHGGIRPSAGCEPPVRVVNAWRTIHTYACKPTLADEEPRGLQPRENVRRRNRAEAYVSIAQVIRKDEEYIRLFVLGGSNPAENKGYRQKSEL